VWFGSNIKKREGEMNIFVILKAALSRKYSAWQNSATKQRILSNPFIITSLEHIRNLALRYGCAAKAQEENIRLTKRGYAVIGGGCLILIFLFARISDSGDSEITDFHSRREGNRGYSPLPDIDWIITKYRVYVEYNPGREASGQGRIRHVEYYTNNLSTFNLDKNCAARHNVMSCSRSTKTYASFFCEANSMRVNWWQAYSGYHLTGRMVEEWNRPNDGAERLIALNPVTAPILRHVCRD